MHQVYLSIIVHKYKGTVISVIPQLLPNLCAANLTNNNSNWMINNSQWRSKFREILRSSPTLQVRLFRHIFETYFF